MPPNRVSVSTVIDVVSPFPLSSSSSSLMPGKVRGIVRFFYFALAFYAASTGDTANFMDFNALASV